MFDAVVKMLMWAKIPHRTAQLIVFIPSVFGIGWSANLVTTAVGNAIEKVDRIDKNLKQYIEHTTQIKGNQAAIMEQLIQMSVVLEETQEKGIEIANLMHRVDPNTELIAKLIADMKNLYEKLPHNTLRLDTIKSIIYVVPNPKYR